MRIVLIISIICKIVFGVNAQILYIKDQNSGLPIESVQVSQANSKMLFMTNNHGEVDISSLDHSDDVLISKNGYNATSISWNSLEQVDYIIKLTQISINVDEITITASRWDQKRDDVPLKVISITPNDVTMMQPQTAADMLGKTGEVFIQKSQQGGGSPMIRGFATNRLLYSVDGIRMNTAIFRGGNIQNVISLDPYAIEKVEVMFGPGSTAYGSDAIGGVMRFQTLDPKLKGDKNTSISGKALTKFSSANSESTQHFDIQIAKGKWASLSSLTNFRFGDMKMGRKGPEEYLRKFYVERFDSTDHIIENPNPLVQKPSGYTQLNMMQKVKFMPSENWGITYGFHYSETSEYSRYDRLIETTTTGIPRSAVWMYGPQIWMLNQLTIDHKADNVFFENVSLKLSQQSFEESRIDRNFSGGQRFRLRTNLEKVDAYALNFDAQKSSGDHHIFYGVEYVFDKIVSEGTAKDIRNNSTISVPDRYPASDWRSFGGFIHDAWKLMEKFNLLVGIRYSNYEIKSDFTRNLSFYPFDFTTINLKKSSLTGQCGFVFSPNNTSKLSLNLSSAFRAPNVDDMGKIFDFNAGEVLVPNPNLKASMPEILM